MDYSANGDGSGTGPLVTAARAGDRHALNALLAEHLSLVYAVVGRALGGGPDVDDVVQETMLRAVQGLPSLRDPDRFRAWLVAIAVRQVQDRLRRASHGPGAAHASPVPLDVVEEVADPSADFVDATHDRIGFAARRDEVLRASQWLSSADRRVLALWWQEVSGTLTRADVAAALSLSQPHTAVRVQRMKAHLDAARTLLRAWLASPRCAELTRAGKGWDRTFHPRWIRKLSWHVQDCDRCAVAGRLHTPTDALLVGAGPMVPPPQLVALVATVASAATTKGWLGVVADTALRAIRRGFDYVNLKSGLALGVGAASTTAVFAFAVHYPAEVPAPQVAPPPPATVAAPSATPAVVPTSPTSLPGPQVEPSAAGVTVADWYVAPDGDDANPGTIQRPLASVGAAVAAASPGETIAVRGGRYEPSEPIRIVTSGTPGARIVLSNYANERPILDASGIPAGSWFITQTGDYWTVQGLEIRDSPAHGYVCRSCAHNVFRRLSIHDSGNTGFMLRDEGSTDNLIADSDFYRNHDTVDNGGSADGLSIKNGSGAGNIVRNCRLYENSGDGLDLSAFTDPVTVTGVWAYGNGVNRWNIDNFTGPGNGIKLGGGDPAPSVDHLVTNSAAWDNAGYGFTEAGNRGTPVLRNNTAYRNGATGFALFYSSAVLRHNLALANATDVQVGEAVDDQENSWNQDGWTTTTLRSGDPTTAEAARGPDWSLPTTTFLLNRKDTAMGATMAASS